MSRKIKLSDGQLVIQSNDGTPVTATILGDLVVNQSLTVNGVLTYLATTDLEIADNTILLNKGETGAGITLSTAGIAIDRGTLSDVSLRYNEATFTWELSNDGSTFNTISTNNILINDFIGLSDTNATSLGNGFLRWNAGGTQVNYQNTIPTTDITGLATVATSGSYTDLINTPTSASFTLAGLSDTVNTSLANGFLRWNATGTQVVYQTTIPTSVITGLAAVATSGSYNDLSDTPTSASFTFTGLSDTNATSLGNGFLRWNAGGTQVVYQSTIPTSVITGLATVATSGSYNDLSDTPTSASFTFTGLSDTNAIVSPNGFLRWNAGGTQVNYQNTIPTTDITGLATVATSGSYTDLINTPTSASFTFTGLSDTNATSLGNGFLRWNAGGTQVNYQNTIPTTDITGLATVATSGSYNDLSDTPANSTYTFTGLSDTNAIVSPNGFLRWNAGGTQVNYQNTIPTTDITGLATVATSGSYTDLINTPANSTYTFTGLSDTNATSLGNGFLRWNAGGTQVVYQSTIPTSVITGLATVATSGSYNDLSDTPANSTYTFTGLSDTNAIVSPNGFLRWNAGGTQVNYQNTIPTTDITGLAAVATSGSYTNLSNTPFIPTNLSGLSDVNTAGAVDNNILSYSGGTWTPVANTLGGISGSQFLRSDENDSFSGTLTSTSGVGNTIFNFGGALLHRITNEGGLAFGSDSSMLLHAGDNTLTLVADLSISPTTTQETLYLTSDGNIQFISNRQVDFASAKIMTFNASGDLICPANIILTAPAGLVDGRNLSSDGAKLDSIEFGATADQTASEIKIAYESNANTNAFTDANVTKLASAITDIVQDTTPQLGGNLDVNGRSITSVSSANIVIEPDGTGAVVLGNSTNDAVLTTLNNGDIIIVPDGTGELFLGDGPSGTITVGDNNPLIIYAGDGTGPNNGQDLVLSGGTAVGTGTNGKVAVYGDLSVSRVSIVPVHTTANRPTTVTGGMIFDTSLGRPIWFNGVNWVDANGTIV